MKPPFATLALARAEGHERAEIEPAHVLPENADGHREIERDEVRGSPDAERVLPEERELLRDARPRARRPEALGKG